MDTITIEFAHSPQGPVTVLPDEFPHFIKGELPPAIADRYVAFGMPRRGLVTFRMQVKEKDELRFIGPNLVRRAGTASSALPRRAA